MESKFNLVQNYPPIAFTPNNQSMLSQRKLILPSHNENMVNRQLFRSSNKENHDYNNFTVDLIKVLKGEDKRTTLMIKNIPNKYNITILREELNYHYDGKYDFLYLPLDPSNNCNLGFAFINLLDPLQILLFYDVLKGKRWQKFNSLKVIIKITQQLEISYAKFQGKIELNSHFEKTLNLQNLHEDKRPFIMNYDNVNNVIEVPIVKLN